MELALQKTLSSAEVKLIRKKLNLKQRELPVRLKYMYEVQLCTVIDVDERMRQVRIKN